MRKEGVSMKKMLAKAVALSLVLGGVGFVANDAHAADIGLGVGVHSADISSSKGYDVKTDKKLPDKTVLAEHKDLVKVNEEVATNKTNIQTNADAIKANGDAIKANGDAIKTKADAWDTAKKFAKVQEMFDNQESKNAELDKKNEKQDKAINANKDAI